jgi:hypothetical protein
MVRAFCSSIAVVSLKVMLARFPEEVKKETPPSNLLAVPPNVMLCPLPVVTVVVPLIKTVPPVWFTAPVAVMLKLPVPVPPRVEIVPLFIVTVVVLAAKADPAFRPLPAEVSRAAMWVRIEVLLLVPLVGFAAAMARWPL